MNIKMLNTFLTILFLLEMFENVVNSIKFC